MLEWVELPGVKGMRYTATDVARSLGIEPGTVTHWIAIGWIKASAQPGGWRIRKAAVRRCLRDYPEAARVVMRAAIKRAQREAEERAGK